MKHWVVAVLLAPALAGCMQEIPHDPTPPAPTTFDGDAAFALLEDFVYDHDGRLRERAPEGRFEEAGNGLDWLRTRAALPGWELQEDIFAGWEYEELDKGSVERYMREPYCHDGDRDDLQDLHFRNVYATLPATGEPTGHVVIAAHWDAKEDAHEGGGPIPAANDGASGVAIMVQLQTHISDANLTFPFDLTMAYFDGEDGFEDCHPLAGSIWSARHHEYFDWPLEGLTQLVLLDMVGDPNARFIRESQSMESDPTLMDALWAEAHARGLDEHFTDTKRPISDDHVPFIEEGFPAIDIIDAGRPTTFPPYWHTMEDTPDKLSPDMLGHVGDLMLWMLTDPDAQALLVDAP